MECYTRGRNMVEENTINLLEVVEKQKNNDLIIFTTFTFDPIFFDGYILRKLKKNNPKALIIILIDAKMYSKLGDDFTRETGVEYALIPIAGNLFHSKIFLFASKSKKQVFLGSHNLTLTGFTQNLELSFDSEDDLLTDDCINYVGNLLKKNLTAKNPWLTKIEPYMSKIDNDILITNETEPILEQCINQILKQVSSIKEIIIFSPYFSKVDELIKKLKLLNPEEVKICIQRKNHNLEIDFLDSIEENSLYELNPTHNSRRLHSKFIVFRNTKKDFILIGSPNFTSPALLKTSQHGNFESALLIEKDFDDFVSGYFKISPISKEEIENSKRKFFDNNELGFNPDTLINFAYFDDFDRLTIEYTSKIKKLVSVIFSSSSTNETITSKDIDLEEGNHFIPFSSLSRNIDEVKFSLDGKGISNICRICSPKGMKIRMGFELEDSMSVQKTLSEVVDFEDIANFCHAVFSTPDEKTSINDSKSSSKVTPSPGKKFSKQTSSNLFDLLNQLFRLSITKTPKGSDNEKIRSKTNSKQREIDDNIARLIERLIIKFEREVIPRSNILKRYSAYLVIGLKILKKLENSKLKGITTVHIISGLNRMIAGDQFFSDLEQKEKLEILLLLLELAKEVELNLGNPYKFDEEGILSGLQHTISQFLTNEKPFVSLIQNLETSEKYGFNIEISKDHTDILKNIFQEILLRMSVHERFEIPKKIIHDLDKNEHFELISSGYDTVKIFLEKDSEVRNKINNEIQFLENKQNIEFVKRIIFEFN